MTIVAVLDLLLAVAVVTLQKTTTTAVDHRPVVTILVTTIAAVLLHGVKSIGAEIVTGRLLVLLVARLSMMDIHQFGVAITKILMLLRLLIDAKIPMLITVSQDLGARVRTLKTMRRDHVIGRSSLLSPY